MKKKEFMDSYNIRMRGTTKEDIKEVRTDYQRNSDYVITYHNGVEVYSKRGTFKDIKAGLSYATKTF